MKTPLQFAHEDPVDDDDTVLDGVKVCDKCSSRFSGDARFCPFDGEPLRGALESEHVADPLLGAVVDERYEVESVLGEGGMGTVYRVRHRVLGRPFALKVLRADLSRDSDLGVRFTREAKAAASISHPNVVQITDFGSLPSGQPYFVMELLVGEPVSSVIHRGGPIPAARAVRMLLQIVEALAAAHAAGIVHRDLKPDNIFVSATSSGEEIVKVLDFGLAKVAGQSRLTKAGLVFGTPHYMSPEQASGGTVDERTDLYALGVVMYEMFTGRVPFEADTYMGVLTKHLYVSPTPPSVHLGGPAELGALEQVILRCLEKKPEKRYPSMAALATELKRVASFSDVGELTIEPAVPAEPRAPHRLADELELPSAAELELALGRRRTESPRLPPWAAGASFGVGAAIVAFAIFAFRARSPTRPAPGPGPEAPFTNSSRAPLAPAAPPSPSIAPVSTATEPPPTASAAPASDARDDAPRVRRARSKSGKPGSAGSSQEARNPSTPKPKMVGGDIVDPWSR